MPPQGPPLGKKRSNKRNATTASAVAVSTLSSGRSKTPPEIDTGSPGQRSSIIQTNEARIIATPVSAAIMVPGNRKISMITNETPRAKSKAGS